MIYSACKHSYRQQWSQKRNRFALGKEGRGDRPPYAVKAAEAQSHSGHRASHPLPPTAGDRPPHSHSLSTQVCGRSLPWLKCAVVGGAGTERWYLPAHPLPALPDSRATSHRAPPAVWSTQGFRTLAIRRVEVPAVCK